MKLIGKIKKGKGSAKVSFVVGNGQISINSIQGNGFRDPKAKPLNKSDFRIFKYIKNDNDNYLNCTHRINYQNTDNEYIDIMIKLNICKYNFLKYRGKKFWFQNENNKAKIYFTILGFFLGLFSAYLKNLIK